MVTPGQIVYACADPCVRFNGDREKLKVIVILARVIDRDEIRPRANHRVMLDIDASAS